MSGLRHLLPGGENDEINRDVTPQSGGREGGEGGEGEGDGEQERNRDGTRGQKQMNE